jgi:hypothetical protein
MNIKRPNSKRRIIYLLRHGDSRRDEVKRFIGQADTPFNLAYVKHLPVF